MQCTNALPAFIISGNGVMINLIVTLFSKGEVRKKPCLIAGKKTANKFTYNNSNV